MYASSLEPSRFRSINHNQQTATYLETRTDIKYAQWKSSLLGMTCKNRRPYQILEIASRRIYEIYTECQNGPPFDSMDPLSLMIIYIEKGSYNPVNQTSRISLTGIPDAIMSNLQQWLFIRWGIQTSFSRPKNSAGRISVFLHLNREGTDKLLSIMTELYELHNVPNTVVSKLGHAHPSNRRTIEDRQKRRRRMRNMTVQIEERLLKEISDAAKKTPDREIFGLLYGDSYTRTITDFVVIPFPSFPGGVVFDSSTLESVTEPKDKECLGWFHSHTGEDLTPSPTDLSTHKRLFDKSYHMMMLVSSKDGRVQIVDHVFTEPRLCSPRTTKGAPLNTKDTKTLKP